MRATTLICLVVFFSLTLVAFSHQHQRHQQQIIQPQPEDFEECPLYPPKTSAKSICDVLKCAYVTVVHDDPRDNMADFWKGVIGWSQSIKETQTPHDRVVIVTGRFSPEAQDILERIGTKVIRMSPFPIPKFIDNGPWTHAWHKLRAFTLDSHHYDLIVFMDVDVLVLKSLDYMFDKYAAELPDLNQFHTQPHYYFASGFPCGGCEEDDLVDVTNRVSGQFMTKTSRLLFEDMVNAAQLNDTLNNDQKFLNFFFAGGFDAHPSDVITSKSSIPKFHRYLGDSRKQDANSLVACGGMCKIDPLEIVNVHFACIGPPSNKPWNLALPFEEGYFRLRDRKYHCLERHVRYWRDVYFRALEGTSYLTNDLFKLPAVEPPPDYLFENLVE